MKKFAIGFSLIFIFLMFTSCSNGKSVSVTDEMDTVISSFIVNDAFGKFSDSEKQFEAHKVYGAKEIDGVIEVYIYSLYMGFNKASKDQEQTGRSGPLLIKLVEDNGTYKAVDFQEPEDGEYYAPSIKEMFPSWYAMKALNDTGKVTKLKKKIKSQVALWLEEEN